MPEVVVRPATERDIPEITRIYNHAIMHTTSTFDTEPKSLDDRIEWFRQFGDRYPLLVAESDGTIAGWGYIRPFGERKAYRYTVENAVYVDCDQQGRGIGSALLGRLIELAREQGYHAILALVVAGNEASARLHERFGFEHTGTMREVGRKFDQWLDLLIYQLIL